MPNPSATAWSSSASRAWFPRAICACAVVFVLVTVTLRWDRASGFTPLIAFGENWAPQRLPALKDLPVATVPGGGYDGQFYAQIAVQPEPTSPVVQKALDNPAYRFRRILLPLLAHVLGGGQPWAILNIYALLNLAAWLWLAAIDAVPGACGPGYAKIAPQARHAVVFGGRIGARDVDFCRNGVSQWQNSGCTGVAMARAGSGAGHGLDSLAVAIYARRQWRAGFGVAGGWRRGTFGNLCAANRGGEFRFKVCIWTDRRARAGLSVAFSAH
jgi:hypothetical protein